METSRQSRHYSWYAKSPVPSSSIAELPGSNPFAAVPPIPKPISSGPKRFIAIGIDFGTTFSGVSWAYSDDPDSINEVTTWPAHPSPRDEPQVPTQINLEGNEWGYLVDRTGTPLRWFKLLLLQDDDIKEDIRDAEYLRDARAQLKRHGSDAVVELISRYLRRIWEHSLEEIRVQIGADIDDLRFRVAVTIPAIWPQYARNKMKEAAKRAGILDPRDIGETFFMLVEEPEAAALSTLFERKRYPDISVGEVFVVCDAGGGTVDIISYKVSSMDPFKVEEHVRGDGKLCGAFLVDDAFENWIQTKAGLKFKNCNDGDFRNFINEEWEYTTKRTFTGRGVEDRQIRPPPKAIPLTRRVSSKGATVTLKSGSIEQFFARSLAGTRDLVSRQVRGTKEREGRNPKRIILVGGLGSSRYIYNELNAQYGNVVSPARPWSAVARGATIKLLRATMENEEFRNGNNYSQFLKGLPEVSSRISKLSYGVESGTPVLAAHPPADKRMDRITTDPDGTPVVWRMRWYLRRNETVDNRAPVSMAFYEYLKDTSMTHTHFKIFTSEEDPPPIRMAPSVKPLCHIDCAYDAPLESLPVVGGFRRLSGMKLTMKFEGEPQWALQIGNNRVEKDVNVQFT